MNKLDKFLKSKKKRPKFTKGPKDPPKTPKLSLDEEYYRKGLDLIVAEGKTSVDAWNGYEDSVSYLESKRNPKAHQMGGGPGRGLYQFEGESYKTALKRKERFNKRNGIKTPHEYYDAKGDASKLSPAHQKALLLWNHREAGDTKFDEINEGKYKDAWLDYHWKGWKSDEERASKGSWYDKHMKSYPKFKPNVKQSTEAITPNQPTVIGKGITQAQDFRDKYKLEDGGDSTNLTNNNNDMKKKYKKGGKLPANKLTKFLNEKKKMSGGGDLAAMGLDAAVPGLGTGLQIATGLVGGFKSGIDELKANDIKLKKNTNPYGLMKDGGSLESQGMKNYVGPSHKEGGIPVNPDGSIGPNGPEVEGKEKAFKFKHINPGTSYVFPKKMKGMIEALQKKYPNSDKISEERASLEKKLDEKKKANEKKNTMAMPKQQMRNGGKLFGGGFPYKTITDGVNNMIKGKALTDINTSISNMGLNNNGVIPGKSSFVGKTGDVAAIKGNKPSNFVLPDSQKIKTTEMRSVEEDNLKGKEEKFRKLANLRSGYQALTGLAANSSTKRRYNPNESEVERLTDSTLRTSKETANKILGIGNTAKTQVRNSNRGQGMTNANLANITANTQKMLGDLGIKNDSIMAGRKSAAANVKTSLGAQRAAEDIRADNIDDMNKAALINRGTQIFDDRIELEKFINNRDVADANFQANLKMIASKYTGSNVEGFLEKLKTATPEEREKLILTMNF